MSDRSLKELLLKHNLQEREALALRETEEEERDRGMAQRGLRNDTCIVYSGGPSSWELRGAVYSCIPALFVLGKEKSKAGPKYFTCHGDKPCGSLSSCGWEHLEHLTHIIPHFSWSSSSFPPPSGESYISWLMGQALPSGLCFSLRGRPGRPPWGEAEKDGGFRMCSPESSYPPSLSEGPGWWSAGVFGLASTVA